MSNIIKQERSLIVSCEIHDLLRLEWLVKETCRIKKIGAYKVGAVLAIRYGLPRVVEAIRKHTKAAIIYDHQKGGTDIPELGREFLLSVKDSGIDAPILFPMTGPVSEEAWIKAAEELDVSLIIGGEMTHKGYKASEGGYISEASIEKMYGIAARHGIEDYVVPGNRPERVAYYRKIIAKELGKEPIFYSPGFIAQGGSIGEMAKVAGSRWHAIVGRGIYASENPGKAAEELASLIP
ncbi:MAG: orotidine 5'-phosphate decarboxylase [Candidatus Marsarchaeota archaeon]|nr:orotidine 5'-phosphate decarboxylase [Candidatus Marsarchaeota archaeon]